MSGSLGPNPPFFGAMTVGDVDTRWLDITAWSAARQGDLPTGTITGTVTPAGGPALVSAALVANVTTAGGPTLVSAIACQLDATGAAPGPYSVVLAFETASGEDIVRAVRLTVRPAS